MFRDSIRQEISQGDAIIICKYRIAGIFVKQTFLRLSYISFSNWVTKFAKNYVPGIGVYKPNIISSCNTNRVYDFVKVDHMQLSNEDEESYLLLTDFLGTYPEFWRRNPK